MPLVDEKSRQAFARAQKSIPGGVNSPVRAFGPVGGNPLFISRGEGAFIWDVDGNRYLDFVGPGSTYLLAMPIRVVAAINEPLSRERFTVRPRKPKYFWQKNP